jgi:crotonobetainyl-CoA:carnitine CoA-transferase CaiB-like acyl-CoA transferase
MLGGGRLAGLLEGIRVLDFGRYIAGPFCAALLADLGAEVIRIERPGGADDRYIMPATASGEGALYLHSNRGKKSVTLDTTKPAGMEIMRRMIAQSDVVIANLSPSALRHFGLDYDSVRAVREDIILTTVSAFASDGPMRDAVGFDGVGQAVSGAVHLTGEPGHPHRSATAYVDFSTALSCAYGTLAAIINRMKTGQGMHVEASLVGTALNIMAPILIEHSAGANPRVPTGNRAPIAGPSDIFQASDGWFIMQVQGPKMFKRWAELMGHPELLDDPRYANDALRGQNGEPLSAIMQGWASPRLRSECIAALEAVSLAAAPVLTPDEVLGDALGLRQSFTYQANLGSDGEVLQFASPVNMTSGTELKPDPAPRLGAHTVEVLGSFGVSEEELKDLSAHGLI